MRRRIIGICALLSILFSGCVLEKVEDFNAGGKAACSGVTTIVVRKDNVPSVEISCELRDETDGSCLQWVDLLERDRDLSSDYQRYILPSYWGYCGENFECVSTTEGNRCVRTICEGVTINAQTDAANCGRCGRKCATGQICVDGSCEGVDISKVLCDGAYIDPNTNPYHCGAKGSCSDSEPASENYAGAHCEGGDICRSGVCSTADQTKVRCDGEYIDPTSDSRHCGARLDGDCSSDEADSVDYRGEDCTQNDAKKLCVFGACSSSCGSSQVICDGKCIDPESDLDYCGAKFGGTCTVGEKDEGNMLGKDHPNYKGERCAAGELCVNGSCRASCPTTQVLCNGKCADPMTNRAYCGAMLGGKCNVGANDGGNTLGSAHPDYMGISCGDGEICADGICALSCGGTTTVCGSQCVDLAATHVKSCTEGVLKCETGYENCDGVTTNGCEVNLLSDNKNCGKCGVVVPASSVCINGVYSVNSCTSGMISCMGEDNILRCKDIKGIDANNCGACGLKCDAIKPAHTVVYGCLGGVCRFECEEPYVNVSDTSDAQIECVDVTTNQAHCGQKGNACGDNEKCVDSKCKKFICAEDTGEKLCIGETASQWECADLTSDENNCGSCGFKCSGLTVPENAKLGGCFSNACMFSCLPGYVNQSGTTDEFTTLENTVCVLSTPK